MEHLKLSKFREECCYCYTKMKESIMFVCKCGLSICDNHKKCHFWKEGHAFLFSIQAHDILTLTSDTLSSEELENIQGRIEQILNNAITPSKPDCPHLKAPGAKAINSRSTHKCINCGLKKNTWLCLECGYVGCGRVQYGREGNGCAMKHRNENNHVLFLRVDTFVSKDVYECYCYECDDYVSNGMLEEQLNVLGVLDSLEEGAKSPKIPETEETEKESKVPTAIVDAPFTGITNSGNTCYISVVIQLIGNILKKHNTNFEIHFSSCPDDPLKCFPCQLMKALEALKHKKSISLIDFINVLESEAPFFKKGEQNDASEFLIYLINRIKECELLGQLPNMSGIFDSETEVRSKCDSCNKESLNYEISTVFNVPLKEDPDAVDQGLFSLFRDSEVLCGCGAVKIQSTRLRVPPTCLLLSLNRWTTKNNKTEKINTPLQIPQTLDLRPFTSITQPDEGLVISLQVLGFKEEEIRNALTRCNNDSLMASEMLFQNKNIPVKEGCYLYESSVSHRGKGVMSGHYLYVSMGMVVDDENVYCDEDDVLNGAYILCYMAQ